MLVPVNNLVWWEVPLGLFLQEQIKDNIIFCRVHKNAELVPDSNVLHYPPPPTRTALY
jgi:hypothetical protein